MNLSKEDVAKIIWPQLQNSKFKEYYIETLLEKYQKRDRVVNIFLVVVTSTSVSAWAIWKSDYLQWLWACLVAFSQIVLLVKPYLNYTRYIKELSEKLYRIQSLNLEYEKLWNNFRFDKSEPEKCYSKSLELKTSLTDYLKFSDGIIISEKRAIRNLAQERVLGYLKITFNYKPQHENN